MTSRGRFTTLRELARLQGFPSSFRWPRAASDRQCVALLGNSMNVDTLVHVLAAMLDASAMYS